MTLRNETVLKTYFNTGDQPSEANFHDLIESLLNPPSICDGRLTLTSGTPVTVSDISAATTIYYTPYKGNRVALYDGTGWLIYTFTERSLSLAGLSADTNYDIFIYDNAGTLTLEAVAWTNDTTRATALVSQDGVYVKSGATGRRYLGTIRINSTGGQTENTVTQRFVWNYYNRLINYFFVVDQTNHSYSSATVRYYNNDSSNKFEYVVGEPSVLFASLQALIEQYNAFTEIGFDGLQKYAFPFTSITAFGRVSASGGKTSTSSGYHYLTIGQHSEGGNQTWYQARLSGILFG